MLSQLLICVFDFLTGVTCPDISNISNSIVDADFEHVYGYKGNFTCDIGFRLQEGFTSDISCEHTGLWNQPLSEGVCESKQPTIKLHFCVLTIHVHVYIKLLH